MKITKLHINGFGKLHDVSMELSEGINLLTGPNETGKTTLHFFLRSMFYGANTKKKKGGSVYDRMRPWKNPEVYGGTMEILDEDGSCYLIERDFAKAPDDLRVMAGDNKHIGAGRDTDGWQEIENPGQVLAKLLHGLSETAYINTVSAGQLSAATERDMAEELRRYAANLTTTVHPELNADRAIAWLRDKRRGIEEEMHPEASREYTRLLGSIKKTETLLERPENENLVLQYEDRRRELKQQTEDLLVQMEDNEAEGKRLEARLAESGYRSTEEIDKAQQLFRERYSRYSKLQEACQGGRARILAIFLLTAGILCLGAGWFIRNAFLMALGALLLLWGILLMIRYRKDLAETEMLRRALEELLLRATGDAALDENAAVRYDSTIAELRENAAALAETARTREELTRRQQQLNRDQSDCIDGLEQQRQAHSHVESELEELKEMRAAATTLRRQISADHQARENLDAIDMAIEKLEQLKENIGKAAGTYLNREASRMVAGLTDGAYHSIDAGSSMDILLNSKDGMIAVNSVSAGTSDQVYLALRLAATRFIAGEDDPVPLLLDDSFALYDDRRLRKAMSFLAENYHGQILIFTCQNREAAALEEEGVPFRRLTM